ncbi:dihydroxyacetone kinase subunit DhaK [Streptomyces sp. NPDC091292]|uniref:dihydroxyacetone kinase subunit DhaK n=1 Tax=Streptomyces sp. NPDC091292 TaxID=3365991 RepID=UPI0038137E01
MSYFLPEDDPVLASCRGLARMHPSAIRLSERPLYLTAADPHPARRVGLVSGGGSGHEPLHAGLLGRGGLDAVCPGQIFASPHNGQIVAASHDVAGPSGVLHIVKNFTGDVLNFSIAAERLRAEGVTVAEVRVGEDVASTGTGAGRRGTAATVAVERILGAAADRGDGLEALTDLGRRVVERSRSLAVAARAHTSPDTLRPAFTLPADHIDYGVGIHGERGARTLPRPPVEALVRRMLDDLLSEGANPTADPTADPTAARNGLLLVVNGLGSTTRLELQAIAAIAGDQLAARGEKVAAVLAGTYITALDTAGFSLTLTALEPGWLELWHGTEDREGAHADAGTSVRKPPQAPVATPRPEPSTDRPRGSRAALDRYAEITRQVHDALGRLDQAAGDGDFGANLRGGLRLAVERVDRTGEDGLGAAAAVFLDQVGDSAGPLLGILFDRLAAVTGAHPGGERPAIPALADASTRALDAIRRAGGATTGDRTLIDALAPAARALTDAPRDADDAITTAALAAITGARATAAMLGGRGRASYVGERALGTPDPGAIAIALLYCALADVYEPQHATRLPAPGYVVQPSPRA